MLIRRLMYCDDSVGHFTSLHWLYSIYFYKMLVSSFQIIAFLKTQINIFLKKQEKHKSNVVSPKTRG